VKKNLTKTHVLFIFTVLCVTVFGLYQKSVTNSLKENDACDITENSCETLVFKNILRVNFEQKPVAEEELFLTLHVGAGLSINNMWIEGVNMYMGKTPVLFENESNSELAVTFLGSCNLQEMQWILNVEVKNDATEEVALRQFTFQTYL
jgi:hypothetical protein